MKKHYRRKTYNNFDPPTRNNKIACERANRPKLKFAMILAAGALEKPIA